MTTQRSWRSRSLPSPERLETSQSPALFFQIVLYTEGRRAALCDRGAQSACRASKAPHESDTIMGDTLTTACGLTLTPMRERDIPALVLLCDANDGAIHGQRMIGREAAVRRLFVMGSALRPMGGGLWTVRSSNYFLIGCVLLRHLRERRGLGVYVALVLRAWGAGHALDIARAFSRRSTPVDDWAGRAEALLPVLPPSLSRVTFGGMLDMANDALGAEALSRFEVSRVRAPVRERLSDRSVQPCVSES